MLVLNVFTTLLRRCDSDASCVHYKHSNFSRLPHKSQGADVSSESQKSSSSQHGTHTQAVMHMLASQLALVGFNLIPR